MQLTFVTDLGQTYAVDIDPDMELENVMALLEAEVSRFLSTPLLFSSNQVTRQFCSCLCFLLVPLLIR